MNKKKLLLITIICVLIAAAITATVIILTKKPDNGEADDTTAATTSPVNTDPDFESIDAGGGLTVVSVGGYSGSYIEDGNDKNVTDVFALVVSNTGDKLYEYVQLLVTVSGNEYSFSISTLLPGKTVRVLENTASAAPVDFSELSVRTGVLIEFSELPSLHSDSISIEKKDGVITLTNISGADITSDISICYKTVADGIYNGGITYRATAIGGLAAGASYSCSSSHFKAETSEIIFISYGK